MKYEILYRHPFNGKLYHIFRERDDCNSKKKIRLKWCKHFNCFGVVAWFSDRIWLINGKVQIIL